MESQLNNNVSKGRSVHRGKRNWGEKEENNVTLRKSAHPKLQTDEIDRNRTFFCKLIPLIPNPICPIFILHT